MGKADQIMDICLLAGEIMLTNGAETYRVEETLERIARAANYKNVHSFVATTGFFLSFEEEDGNAKMQMIRVDDRCHDLNKITLVNEVSREFVMGLITPDEAHKKLNDILLKKMNYPIWLLHFASGIAGGGFSFLFGGGMRDIFPAFIAGVTASIVLIEVEKYLRVKFFAEFIAAFAGGAVAIALVFFGIGVNLNQIIIGTLMPLVPGVPLTNAVRDLMSGDLLAGVSRGAEATITSLSIATGIALAITIFL